MRNTERSIKTPSLRTGRFVTLRGLLPHRGSGASSLTVRTFFAFALPPVTLALILTVCATPAAAASPPVVAVDIPLVTQTTAGPFGAEVYPNEAATEYRFEYASREASDEYCGGTLSWRAVPGGSGTVPAEPNDQKVASEKLTGLTAEADYCVRVVVKNSAGKEEKALAFKTVPLHPKAEPPKVSRVTTSTVHLDDEVVPDNFATDWWFEYAVSKVMLEEGRGTRGPEGTIGAGEANESIHDIAGDLAGLSASKAYYIRLVAENGHGENNGKNISRVVSFETAGPPAVATFSARGFDGEQARALGSIQPRGYDTHYYSEYVTQGKFDASGWAEAERTPPLDAGPGEFESVNGVFPTTVVGVDLPGLQRGVSYRYRLVAASAAPGSPVIDGNEQALTVPAIAQGTEAGCPNEALRSGPSAKLPDCRAYEQVTPVDKEGAQDIYRYGVVLEAALVGEDGDHFMLHVPGVQWGRSPDPSESDYFFARTPGGWQMTSARPPGEAGPDRYLPGIFSPDLTQVGIEAEWATNEVAFSPDVEFKTGPPGGPYTTVASIPRTDVESEHEWVGASADGSKFILQTTDRDLIKGHPTGTTSGNDLYEFSAGVLRQVNVGPGGSPISTCGAELVKGYEGYEGGSHNGVLSSPYAVSADGARVFFEDNCTHNLYMRVDGAETIDIGEYTFLAANRDGSELLLEKQNGETHEFFLYDIESMSARTLFSTQQAIFTEVGGGRPVVSEDLSTIYFFSTARLTADAPPRSTEEDQIGPRPEDLYSYDIRAGTLRFVVQSGGDSGGGFTGHSTSLDGRYFYWITTEVAGVPGGASSSHSEQVYRYDDVENVVQCMSCASPFDPEPKLNATFLDTELSDGVQDGVPIQADASANGDYVFFDTPAALVPQDIDGEVKLLEGVSVEHAGGEENNSTEYSVSSDVYEWRKYGIDGCLHVQGCLALISSGTGGFKNVLLGTADEGRDVFFTTHESLVPGDDDTAGDVYDARIDGGFPPPAPRPTECKGDSCSTPFAAPSDLTPSSATFQGAGDLAPEVAPPPAAKKKVAPKRKVKRKSARKKKRRKKKTAAKASNKRRAQS